MDYIGKMLDDLGQLGMKLESNHPDPTQSAGYTRAQERAARSKGFPSAKAAVDWERQKQKSQQPQAVSGIGQAVKAGVDAAMSMHPKNLLDYVLNSINDATGQGGK